MKAHLAADYQIGDPADDMIDIPWATCAVCGGLLDPLCGKVLEGTTLRWDVWISGNYEHHFEPLSPHIPIPTYV